MTAHGANESTFIFVKYAIAIQTPLSKKFLRHNSNIARAVTAIPGTSWYRSMLYAHTIGIVATNSHAHEAAPGPHIWRVPKYTARRSNR